MTNSEIRMTNQIRNPNDETVARFGFRHSELIRHSSFGIRIFLGPFVRTSLSQNDRGALD